MIVPPIRRTSSSNIEVNFLIGVNAFLPQILNFFREHNIESTLPQINVSPAEPSISLAQRAVVSISIGNFWGSGILISRQGHILTCAHLFAKYVDSKGTLYSRIRVWLCTDQWIDGQIEWISKGYLDFALVRVIPPKDIEPIPWEPTITEPKAGQDIFVIGHAIWGPSKKLRATCSSGSISNIVFLHGKPAIIQTNALVYGGASGGLLINKEGQFLGVIVSNTSNIGVLIPRMNYCIPASNLLPLQDYFKTGDKKYMEFLSIQDTEGENLWKLNELKINTQVNLKKQSKFLEFIQHNELNTNVKRTTAQYSRL